VFAPLKLSLTLFMPNSWVLAVFQLCGAQCICVTNVNLIENEELYYKCTSVPVIGLLSPVKVIPRGFKLSNR
jgi:hypothetical protein